MLDLSRVKLRPDTIQEIGGAVFPNLKNLLLCKNNWPSEKYEVISKTFPNVIALELRGSIITMPVIFSGILFANIIKLNLAYCKIRNFQDVQVLSEYPNLAELKLCNNPIERFEYISGFGSLKKLNLEGTSINDLVSVNFLNSYPILSEIRMGNTPLALRLKDHMRKVMIAYLPKATKINGGYVESKERVLHERQFVRDFSDPNNSKEHTSACEYLLKLLGFSLETIEVDINQNVFLRLLQNHGTVHKFAEISLAPPTTANLIFETEDGRKEIKEVPLGWKVLNLKRLCKSLFGIPETQQKLYYVDCEMAILGAELLRFENKALYTHRMKDNDSILVRVKD